MPERDEQLERGTAAPVRSAPESEAAAPVAFLPTALGNQAFGSLVATGVLPVPRGSVVHPQLRGTAAVAARALAVARAAPAETTAAPASGAPYESPLSPAGRELLAAMVVEPLRVVHANLDPAQPADGLQLAVNHLGPPVAALALFTEPGDGDYGGVRDPDLDAALIAAHEQLTAVERRLGIVAAGKPLDAVAEPWILAQQAAVQYLASLKGQEGSEPAVQLLEGSLIPSLTNAVQEVMAPDPDFQAVLRNNAGTLRTLEAAAAEEFFGDALARPTERFRLGLEALELIVADDPTTISDARADISMHLSMLEEIAAGRPLFGIRGP